MFPLLFALFLEIQHTDHHNIMTILFKKIPNFDFETIQIFCGKNGEWYAFEEQSLYAKTTTNYQ